MTQKDQKTLLVLFLSLAGVGLVCYSAYAFFLGPLSDYGNTIERLEGEITVKETEYRQILRDKKLLTEAREHSLPVKYAVQEYTEYLTGILEKSGLSKANSGVAPAPPGEAKAALGAPVAAGTQKKAGHQVLTYTVHAEGTLASAVKALEAIQRTPLLHRVKTLSLNRPANAKDTGRGNLVITMNIEAMIAAGTKPDSHPSLAPDMGIKLPTEADPRKYSQIALKDIFTGPVPPRPPLLDGGGTAADQFITEHVRLDTIDLTTGEAWLRHLLTTTKPTRLRAKAGFDQFQVWSELGTEVLVKGIVLKIEQRDVFFQVKDNVYRLHMGQTIAEALRRALPDAEIESFALTNLVREYDPKVDPAEGKSSYKGPKTGGKAGGGKTGGKKNRKG